MEAAGVEPAPLQKANWLMARDFSSELAGNSLPCGQLVVLWSAPQCSGVLPSLGDMLETLDRAFASSLTATSALAAATGFARCPA